MKRVLTAVLAVALCGVSAMPVGATVSVPYESYNYDYRENIVLTPAPYVPDGSVSGEALGIGAFNKARDLAVDADGRVYVADTGNNRVVILSADMKSVTATVDGFDNGGKWDTFNAPAGVALSDTGRLYVADSDNHRVVALEADLRTLAQVIENPVSDVLPEGFVFVPIRLCVDYAGRVYVIAQNMFQGILLFEPNGEFSGFFGTIDVQITLWQRFWRAIATKSERANARLFVPTEFTGLDVDPAGFVYASNMDATGEKAVRRLNPKGQDVALQGENKHTGGDLTGNASASPYAGVSRIVDVAYMGKGIYALLDSRRGRVFAYDREGNLLYIFGGLGTQEGAFRTPSAIATSGGRVLVLDYVRNEIALFKETRYGQLINEAVGLRFDGDEMLAVAKWRQVLALNENLELANVGIGKAYLTAGDNVLAMKHLKLGMDRHYYSIAFRRYRNDILKKNLGWVLTTALGVLAAGLVARYILKRRRGAADE